MSVKTDGTTSAKIIYKDYRKAYDSLDKMSRKDLFRIKLRGYDFDILPWLLSSIGYMDNNTKASIYSIICDYHKECKPFERLPLKDNELWETMRIMMPAYTDWGLRTLSVYAYELNPKWLTRTIFNYFMQCISDIIYDGYKIPYLVFEDKEICNTQAFGYVCGIAWVLKLVPQIRMMKGVDVRKLKLTETLEMLCPEDSIHFKLIKGDITLAEAKELYTKEVDGRCVLERELMSIVNEGHYDGSVLTEKERNGCLDLYNHLKRFDDVHFFNLNIAYAFYFDGKFNALMTEIDDLKRKKELAENSMKNAEDSTRRKREEIKRLERTIDEQDKTIRSLNAKVDNYITNEDLLKEIDDLKSKLRTEEERSERYTKESLELKRVISGQKKEIKKLRSSLDALPETDKEIVEEFLEEKEVTFEEALIFLKDKFIIVAGGIHQENMFNRLEELGLNIKIVQNSVKLQGKCDVGVVLTTTATHHLSGILEKFIRKSDTPIVYYNGTNVDNLVIEIYKEMN